MDNKHVVIYAVCGVVAFIAISVAVVAGCLICQEKRKRKKKNEKRDEYKERYEKNHPKPPNKPRVSTGLKPPRAYPRPPNTRTEQVQPGGNLEQGLDDPPRPKSAFGFRPTQSANYQRLDEEDPTRLTPVGLNKRISRSVTSLNGSLLQIPFSSGRTSSCSGTNSEAEDWPPGTSGLTTPTKAESLGREERRKNSVFSMSSWFYEHHNSIEHLGSIYLSVHYDFEKTRLVLKIIKATELAAKDFGGTSDPYVKIKLLPDKNRHLTTKVRHRNLNPIWNETFLFEGYPYDKVRARTLHLEVLDKDRLSADDPIGEVYLPLSETHLGHPEELCYPLKPIDPDKYRLGEILIALSFDPQCERLSCQVIKCRDLKPMDIASGKSDPYVKIWHLQGGQKIWKVKTKAKKKELNPVFNETFTFNVTQQALRDTQLRVIVRDHDTLTSNETIGAILLAAQSGTSEMKQWNEMMLKPKTAVSAWHILRKLEF